VANELSGYHSGLVGAFATLAANCARKLENCAAATLSTG
jgi:hypothetical protein